MVRGGLQVAGKQIPVELHDIDHAPSPVQVIADQVVNPAATLATERRDPDDDLLPGQSMPMLTDVPGAGCTHQPPCLCMTTGRPHPVRGGMMAQFSDSARS